MTGYPTTQAEIDSLLTGLELELVIAAVKANTWTTIKDDNGFTIPMNPQIQKDILRKLEARRTS